MIAKHLILICILKLDDFPLIISIILLFPRLYFFLKKKDKNFKEFFFEALQDVLCPFIDSSKKKISAMNFLLRRGVKVYKL